METPNSRVRDGPRTGSPLARQTRGTFTSRRAPDHGLPFAPFGHMLAAHPVEESSEEEAPAKGAVPERFGTQDQGKPEGHRL